MVCTVYYTVVKQYGIEFSGLDLRVHALVIEIACQLAGNFQKIVWLTEGSAGQVIYNIVFKSAVVIELIIFAVGCLLAAERCSEHLHERSLHLVVSVGGTCREDKRILVGFVADSVNMKIGNLYIRKVYCHISMKIIMRRYENCLIYLENKGNPSGE